jgi:xanthine dehydrogenase accessory factor
VTHPELATLEVPAGEAYAVVATMGHFDEDALEVVLSHPEIDVSLIASTRRSAAVRKALLGRGLDEHTLARVRTPAGKVRGGTQEEIALLALAEIVSSRRKRPVKVPTEVAQVTFVTDPVCGMTVDPLTSTRKSTYNGVDYWFCSDGCKAEFEKDPQRLIARA